MTIKLLVALLFSVVVVINAQLPAHEQEVLIEMKKAMSHPLDSVWGTDFSKGCVFDGIKCDDARTTVLEIILPGKDLVGEITPYIGNLTSLVSIDLSINPGITGKIPDTLGKLTNLKTLSLDQNKDLGYTPFPDIWGALNNLQILGLSGIKFLPGPLPNAFVTGLPSLDKLRLSGTNLVGDVPAAFWSRSFAELDLRDNSLTGSVAPLGGFQAFSIAQNLFSGSFPDIPPTLRQIDISYNSFSGPLPESLSDAIMIQKLDISSNRFTGSLPNLTLLTYLNNLQVDDNELNLCSGVQLPPQFLAPVLTGKCSMTNQNGATCGDPSACQSQLDASVCNGHYDTPIEVCATCPGQAPQAGCSCRTGIWLCEQEFIIVGDTTLPPNTQLNYPVVVPSGSNLIITDQISIIDYGITISGGNLTFSDSASLVVSNGITVTSGQIIFQDQSSLSTGSGIVISGGSMTFLAGSSCTMNSSITVDVGNLTLQDSATLILSPGNLSTHLANWTLGSGVIVDVSGTIDVKDTDVVASGDVEMDALEFFATGSFILTVKRVQLPPVIATNTILRFEDFVQLFGDIEISGTSDLQIVGYVEVIGNFSSSPTSKISFSNFTTPTPDVVVPVAPVVSKKRQLKIQNALSPLEGPIKINATEMIDIGGPISVNLTSAEVDQMEAAPSPPPRTLAGGSSVSTNSAVTTNTPSTDCRRVDTRLELNPQGSRQTLNALFNIDPSDCNKKSKSKTWWIVTVAVLGSVVFLVILVILLALFVPAIGNKLLPSRSNADKRRLRTTIRGGRASSPA